MPGKLQDSFMQLQHRSVAFKTFLYAIIAGTIFVFCSPLSARQSGPPPDHNPLNGPWNHDLQMLEFEDGNNFSARRTIIDRAGVPCVARDNSGRLILVFQWFPYDDQDAFDKVAVSFSDDDGETWTYPEPINIEEFPENFMRPFDPTIVVLKDGSFRLYFTSKDMSNSPPSIYSAVSHDALNYVFEKGERSVDKDGGVVDSSAVYWNGEWHLFAHEFMDPRKLVGNVDTYRERAYHAVSKDGINFTAAERILLPEGYSWIGNFIVKDGTLVFYGSGKETWSAESDDGYNWGFRTGGRTGGDPTVFQGMDGKYRVIVTGPLRDDASVPPFQKPRK